MVYLKDVVKVLTIRNYLCDYAYNKCGIKIKSVKVKGQRLSVITKEQVDKIYDHYYNKSNDYVKVKSIMIPINDLYNFFNNKQDKLNVD